MKKKIHTYKNPSGITGHIFKDTDTGKVFITEDDKTYEGVNAINHLNDIICVYTDKIDEIKQAVDAFTKGLRIDDPRT